MEMPKDTPSGVVKLVQQCWAKNPDERPDFSKIFKSLRSMKT
uniref:Serine-threonine/tyrosine-protein kinase catalytic domain-containing protein n=1 Tax=Wuchereria bancrofti TaxID=6293 RepID=A0AAF5Q4J8_WUCBA